MKVTVFTSNQPRHLALLSAVADVASEVFAIQECNTIFPGQRADFYRKSEIMQEYFARVLQAEARLFGPVRFLPANVHTLSLKDGDLNMVPIDVLEDALHADVLLVFGSSFIKGPLVERLIAAGAINIHMGVSPYFRGSSCNFWAIHDGHPELVGATIHRLSRGLDSGGMLFHALPAPGAYDPFDLGMSAVKAAHAGIIRAIADGTLRQMPPQEQDKRLEIRYSRNADFTDEVAARYLAQLPTPDDIAAALARRQPELLLNPFFQ